MLLYKIIGIINVVDVKFNAEAERRAVIIKYSACNKSWITFDRNMKIVFAKSF